MVEFRKWQKRYAEETIAVRKIQKWWRKLKQRHSMAEKSIQQVVAETIAKGTSDAGRTEEEVEGNNSY